MRHGKASRSDMERILKPVTVIVLPCSAIRIIELENLT
jgi:hypothetical protein